MDSELLTVCGRVDPLGLAAVQRLLNDQIIASAWYAESTASTNSIALDELSSGAASSLPFPRLLLADQQTSGRGRRGRAWLSSNETLTFSILLSLDTDPPLGDRLSLAVGVGIAQSLEFDLAPLRTRLKWPNDVYAGGGKVAGILLETTAAADDLVVIGVGLNVGAPPEIADSSSQVTACSLKEATGRMTGRYDHLYSILQHLLTTIEDMDSVVREFRDRCMLTGKPVRYFEGSQPCEGQCLGVDDWGALVVESKGGTKRLRSGEVHLIREGRNG